MTATKTKTEANANPELRKSQSTGGFNAASGDNRKYIPGRFCWSVFYTDGTGYRAEICFRRKRDAVAVFGWMLATNWSGVGDFEGPFLEWANNTQHAVASTFKGEF
jgi:hypothetical protein